MTMERVVQPELLDELPFDDPEAVRSRREICLINQLAGNFRWIRNELRKTPVERVIEIGAGSGGLLCALQGEGRSLVGVDLAPRPPTLPASIDWKQNDLREVLRQGEGRGAAVVATLMFHQFEDGVLREMGKALRESEAVLACEPLRSRRAKAGLALLRPIFNRVTWHDGVISVRAGFRHGELAALLGFSPDAWEIKEGATPLGVYRFSARRRRS